MIETTMLRNATSSSSSVSANATTAIAPPTPLTRNPTLKRKSIDDDDDDDDDDHGIDGSKPRSSTSSRAKLDGKQRGKRRGGGHVGEGEVIISTTETTRKRVKIDGFGGASVPNGPGNGNAGSRNPSRRIGDAIAVRLERYDGVMGARMVDVSVGINVDGKDGINVDIDLETRFARLQTRQLHRFLRTTYKVLLEKVDREYEDADEEVMAGKATASLYARRLTPHLQGLEIFRAHGVEGVKMAAAFMAQIAMRLVGAEQPPSVLVKRESKPRHHMTPESNDMDESGDDNHGLGQDDGGGGDIGEEKESKTAHKKNRRNSRLESGHEKRKRELLWEEFDSRMWTLLRERQKITAGHDWRWVNVLRDALKAMKAHAVNMGLGHAYFTGTLKLLDMLWQRFGKRVYEDDGEMESLFEFQESDTDEDDDEEDEQDEGHHHHHQNNRHAKWKNEEEEDEDDKKDKASNLVRRVSLKTAAELGDDASIANNVAK